MHKSTWRENINIVLSTHIHFRAKETYFCDAWISLEIKNIIKIALIRMMLLWIKWKVNLCIQPQKNVHLGRILIEWDKSIRKKNNLLYWTRDNISSILRAKYTVRSGARVPFSVNWRCSYCYCRVYVIIIITFYGLLFRWHQTLNYKNQNIHNESSKIARTRKRFRSESLNYRI